VKIRDAMGLGHPVGYGGIAGMEVWRCRTWHAMQAWHDLTC